MDRKKQLVLLLLITGSMGLSVNHANATLRNSPGITLPQPGTLITTAPLQVRVDLSAGAASNGFQATLNGADITPLFAPPVNQILSALVPAQDLKNGSNSLEVSGITGLSITSVTFTYDPSKQLATDSSTTRYKPITTRVLRPGAAGENPQDYGISVGDSLTGVTTYYAPAYSGYVTGKGGFQVLTLGRDSTRNQAAFSNQSYPTETLALPGSPLTDALFRPMSGQISSHCGPAQAPNGCILVIQSLVSIGNTGCNFNYSSKNCQGDLYTLSQWGMAEPFAMAQNNSHVAYSFIGNVSYSPSTNFYSFPPQGLAYERLTCNSSSNGDCVVTTPYSADNIPYTLENTAPSNGTPDQIGRISGALVRDNTTTNSAPKGAYTFAPTEQLLSFAVVNNPSNNSNEIVFTAASDTTIDANGKTVWWSAAYPDSYPPDKSWSYPSKPIVGDNKGIRLFIIDASPFSGPPTVLLDETFPLTYQNGLIGTNLQDLPGYVTQACSSRRCLFFLSVLGTITQADRAASYAGNPYTVNDIWNYLALAVASIGGDYRTFQQLSMTPFTVPTAWPAPAEPPDQYTLVGYHSLGSFWHVATVGAKNFSPNAAEISTFILRQTQADPAKDPNTGDIACSLNGFLKVDHAGYLEPYRATNYRGASSTWASQLQAAAFEPSGDWPVCGSTNCTQGQKNAYRYLSNVVSNNSTADLRSEYSENTNDPTQYGNWISSLNSANGQNPCRQGGTGYSQSDCYSVQQELISELTALESLANFEQQMSAFFTETTLAKTDTITAIASSFEADLQIDTTQAKTTPPEWLQIFNDAIAVAGPVSAFAGLIPGSGTAIAAGSGTAISILGLVVDSAAQTTSSNNTGTPLQATEEVEQTVSQIFSNLTDNYLTYINSLNTLVARIATDANRLNHFYATEQILAANKLDPTSPGAFDIAVTPLLMATKRQVYTKLIASSYDMAHFQYSAPDFSPGSDHNIHDAYGIYDFRYTGYDDAKVCEVGRALFAGHNATMFYPGNLIDGVQSHITIGTHTYPHDLWWDFWGIGIKGGIQQDCPQNENFQNADNNFVKYGLLLPVAQGTSTDPSSIISGHQALGIYQSYFFNPRRTGINLLEFNTDNSYWSCNNNSYNFSPRPSACYPSNGDSFQ